ncbi:MAG: hypothetical protein IH614_09350 [Desulfuromonadales bacterium]|nr:hypothetical protein [Desulfuromonadales bacterium]
MMGALVCGKSIFKHIPPQELNSILEQIQKRRKIEEQINAAKKRIQYLDQLIAVGRPQKKVGAMKKVAVNNLGKKRK